MSSQNLLALKAELEAAQAVLLPQIEGLHDFARLNIKPETLTKVQETTVDFERRRDLQVAALAALQALEQDNYPETPNRQVVADVYADLQDNVSTITAAFAKFDKIDEAVSAVITTGTPELKP